MKGPFHSTVSMLHTLHSFRVSATFMSNTHIVKSLQEAAEDSTPHSEGSLCKCLAGGQFVVRKTENLPLN